jgi:hypothetical protein
MAIAQVGSLDQSLTNPRNVTVPAGANLLLVTIYGGFMASRTGSYDGVALDVGYNSDPGGVDNSQWVQFLYMIDPPEGTHELLLAGAGGGDVNWVCSFWSGVASFGSAAVADAASISRTVSSEGALIVTCIQGTSGAHTPTAGATELLDDANGSYFAYLVAPSPGSHDVGATTYSGPDLVSVTFEPILGDPEPAIVIESSGSNTSDGSGSTNTQNVTIPTGDDRRLFACVQLEGAGDPPETVSSVTCGGEALSAVSGATSQLSVGRVQWWELLDADFPSTGTQSLVATLSGTRQCVVGYVIVSGASQDAVLDTDGVSTSSTGTTLSATLNVAAGAMVLAGLYTNDLAGASAPTFVEAGTAASGSGAISVAWPSHQLDDIGILFVATEDAAVATPSGWNTTGLPARQGTGGAGGTNSASLTAFWRRAQGGSESNATAADPGDVWHGRIFVFRGCAGAGSNQSTSPINASAGSTSGASTSVTFPAVTTTSNNCMVVLGVADSLDSASTSRLSSTANANLSSIAERGESGTTTGDGAGLSCVTGIMATAGSTSTTSATITSTAQGRMTIALTPADPSPNHSANIADSAATEHWDVWANQGGGFFSGHSRILSSETGSQDVAWTFTSSNRAVGATLVVEVAADGPDEEIDSAAFQAGAASFSADALVSSAIGTASFAAGAATFSADALVSSSVSTAAFQAGAASFSADLQLTDELIEVAAFQASAAAFSAALQQARSLAAAFAAQAATFDAGTLARSKPISAAAFVSGPASFEANATLTDLAVLAAAFQAGTASFSANLGRTKPVSAAAFAAESASFSATLRLSLAISAAAFQAASASSAATLARSRTVSVASFSAGPASFSAEAARIVNVPGLTTVRITRAPATVAVTRSKITTRLSRATATVEVQRV